MGEVTVRAAGPLPADQAWERYADLDRWTSWAPQIRRVEATGRRLAPGLTGSVVGPAGFAVRFRVDSVDAERRTWSWTVRLGLLTVHLLHRVSHTETGTATDLTLRGPLPVLIGYAPVGRWALRRLVRP